MTTKVALVRLGKREQTKARNRAVILAAARKVFAHMGKDQATVRDVVAAANLSVGAFYAYFRDKEDVFAAVVREVESEVVRRFREVRRDTVSSRDDRIFRAFLLCFDFAAEEPQYFAVAQRHLFASPADAGFGRSISIFRDELAPTLASDKRSVWEGEAMGAFAVGAMMGVANRVSLGLLAPQTAARQCTEWIGHLLDLLDRPAR